MAAKVHLFSTLVLVTSPTNPLPTFSFVFIRLFRARRQHNISY